MQLTQYTKALSDETRLRILMLLVNSEELCVCQLTQVLGLSQPKISRHLAVLRDANILQDRKAGLWVFYRLSEDLSTWVMDNLQSLHLAAAEQEPFKNDLKIIDTPEIKKLSNFSECNGSNTKSA